MMFNACSSANFYGLIVISIISISHPYKIFHSSYCEFSTQCGVLIKIILLKQKTIFKLFSFTNRVNRFKTFSISAILGNI